jgi:hypothetical protein
VRAAKCRLFSAHGFPGFFCVHDSARESQKLPVGAVRKKINGLLFIYVPNAVQIILKFPHCAMESVQHD